MSDQMGGYPPQGGHNPQGGYPGQPPGGYPPQGGYGQPQGYQPQGGYGQPQGYGPHGYGGGPGYGPAGGGISFDLSRIMPGGAVAVGAGLLTFIFSFLPWYKPDCGSVPSEFRDLCDQHANAWDRTVAWFSVLLFVIGALAFVAKALKVVPEKVPLEVVALAVVVLGDILFLVALLNMPGSGDGVTQAWALWVSLLLVIGLNVGTVMEFMKVGGVNTLKSGLSRMQSASGNAPYGGPQQGWGQQPGYPQQGGYPPQGQRPAPPQQPPGYPQQGYPTGPQSGPHPAQPQQGGYPPQGQRPAPPQQPPGYPQQGGGYPQGGGF